MDGTRPGIFHDLVLKAGAVPLTILREVVEDWIAQGRAVRSAA